MTKEQTLAKIKTLRDEINDRSEDAGINPNIPASDTWINQVCFHLDAAADIIEFPKGGAQ